MLPERAAAFGDKGHEVVALVAQAHLSGRAKAEVERLLQGDREGLAMRDGGNTSESFARQATWADYYRDAQRNGNAAPEAIHSYSWHFIDLELRGGTIDEACFGFPALPPATPASAGVDPACVVDKIAQFAAELASPSIGDDEKRIALKYLLHLVGDVHQPLHAGDDGDHGGNGKRASVGAGRPAPLHHHWDVTFVERIAGRPGRPGFTAAQIAKALPTLSAGEIAEARLPADPRRWALESFALARDHAYGALPVPVAAGDGSGPVYLLGPGYVEKATELTARQLSKAGLRLAALLDRVFAEVPP